MSDERLLLHGKEEDLATLERHLNVVRDHVTGVAKGFKTGLFLHGDGGVGKSHTVLRQLEFLGVPYKLYNSRMTAKGLFLALADAPDAIHVLEDMERLTKDPHAQGVLRSALWSQSGHDRIITWNIGVDKPQPVVFRGGLILISNRPLADLPELRALATRIEVHMLNVTDAELTALMLHLASQGYQEQGKMVVGPDECVQVTEFLLKECRAAGCRLDLRLQQKSFQTYRQWEMDWAATDWRDLIASSVREATHHFRHESNSDTPENKKKQRRNILREIIGQTSDVSKQEERYIELTGKSRADFFRRKYEINGGDFDEQDAA